MSTISQAILTVASLAALFGLVLVVFPIKKKIKEPKPKSKWDRVMEKYPVGTVFTYRTGHKMTVVSAIDELDGGENWEPGYLNCEYVDNQGRICHLEFSHQQADFLLSL